MTLRLAHLARIVIAACPLIASAQAATEIHVPAPPLAAAKRPQAAVLIDRLCANTLRANEGDRLLGIVSLTARSTIKYLHGIYSPDLIDDAVQNTLSALIDDCPALIAAADDQRLSGVVDLAIAQTAALIHTKHARYTAKQIDKATAADLSQELTSREIDAWFEAMPPRRRAVAAFLYASDVTPADIAAATGVPRSAIAGEVTAAKTTLLKFYRQENGAAPAPGTVAATDPLPGQPAGPTLSLADLLAPGQPEHVVITGISSDLYSGGSLLAVAKGLPDGAVVTVPAPFLLQPDAAGARRMLVTGLVEISDPGDATRRFLVTAYSIDGGKEGSGWRDKFHLATAAITNPAALATLANRDLSAIEKTRCLAYDYATTPDPGLCRDHYGAR